jgi:seryl-tRNA synthetase
MHDIRAIRETPDFYVKGWSARGVSEAAAVVGKILELDARLRAAQTSLQEAQARRNDASKLIGQAKAQKDEAKAQALMTEVEQLKAKMAEQFELEGQAGAELKGVLEALPNLAAEGVPPGEDEHGNVELRRSGDAKALPAGRLNEPKDHVALGEAIGGMDFEAAVRMSGSRFVVLKGQVARLERAIGQFMLDLQTREHGYLEVAPPMLVRSEAMYGTGQLPKFEEDLFTVKWTDWDAVHSAIEIESEFTHHKVSDRYAKIKAELESQIFDNEVLLVAYDEAFRELQKEFSSIDAGKLWRRVQNGEWDENRYLIPTAEVSLTNLVREQVTDETELPLRLTALTACFRAEAGASGRDTRGMIRQHQFNKVELVSITTPEQSEAEHERMVGCAEEVLKRLDLEFRTMILCAGDMGFSARRTYDLEVWLPSQQTFREISSCSNCGDFQARRMDARCRVPGEKGTRFVHTLNGSGLAVGRTLIAVMENYQDEGGRIAVPDALLPYMGGLTHIGGAG